jgi:hypothetical protein
MMSPHRKLALGALAAAALAAPLVIAAAPVINETVAIVDPNTPTQQAGVDAGGNLKVNCTTGCSAGSGTGANNADGVATQSTGLGQTTAYPFLYNGATYDRWAGSASRGADVNLKDVAGAAINTGHGTAAGSIRVELPTDGTGVVGLAAGTNIVGKIGIDQTTPGTTNGVQINAALPSGTNTIGAVTPAAATSGGSTAYHLSGGSAASTNSTNVKASAGTVYNIVALNTSATLAYLRLYNASSAPTCSSATGVVHDYPVPANASGAGLVIPFPTGEAYSTGIGFCLTGGGTDTDATNAPTGVYVEISYK